MKSRRKKISVETGFSWLGTPSTALPVINSELETRLVTKPMLREFIETPSSGAMSSMELEVEDLEVLGLAGAKILTGPLIALSDLDRLAIILERSRELIARRDIERSASDEDALDALWESQMASIDSENALNEDLEKYLQIRPWEQGGELTRPILRLVAPPSMTESVSTTEGSVRDQLVASFKAESDKSVLYLLESLGSQEKNRWGHLPSLDTYHRGMDRQWLNLSSAMRWQVLDDIRETLILWKIAEPVINHPSRPGVSAALTYGLQLSLKSSESKSVVRAESAVGKSLNNLRASWAFVITKDPTAAQWAALVLRPRGTIGELGTAIRSMASDDIAWAASPGRKPKGTAVSMSVVQSWVCDSCGCEFAPGDHSHDSPGAVSVGRSIEGKSDKLYGTHSRVLFGLPDRAHQWQRLMCAELSEENDSPCWARGGVLVPTFV
jgi:hypothetical protein